MLQIFQELLAKFSKTQDKLVQLKLAHKSLSKIKENETKLECLPPRPENKTVTQIQAKPNSNDNATFTPHKVTFFKLKIRITKLNTVFYKSSTPRDMSPIEERKEEVSRPTILDKNDDDLKRIDLIKQRMELMTEQQQLRKLLDQQENMLKEKQVHILII